MYNILYVEDQLWDYQSHIDVLSRLYNVLTARDAKRALDTILEAQAAGKKIDLIILDISLSYSPEVPDLANGKTAGVEFARVLLREWKLDIPIICYTTNNNVEIYRQLLDLGVKEIISRTKGIRDLIGIIQKYLPAAAGT